MHSTPRHKPGNGTSNAETRTVRYSGVVQPHGVLLVLDRVSCLIVAASETSQTLLGLSADHLLGQTLGQIFGHEVGSALLALPEDAAPTPLPLHGLCATVCRNESGQILVDIEPCEDASSELTSAHRLGLKALRKQNTVASVTQAATDLIRTLTGFEQVMIYRFDATWRGEVIAESIANNISTCLGQRWASNDAREIFQLCSIHQVPDVHYSASMLLASIDPRTIDLGKSRLRSISPTHIEYLKNMGAHTSLMLALVVEDRLWGWVSCQQQSGPKYFTPAQRDALGWLCEDISALIEARLLREQHDQEHEHFRQVQHIASLGSWEWDLATGVNRWSDQQYRIFGYEPKAVRPSYELFHQALHPDDRSKVMGAVEDAINDLAPYDVVFRIVRPDRSIWHLHSLGRVERDSAGTALRITGTTLDITQRFHSQQRMENLLTEQKALLENHLVGIAKAQNRKIVWANPAFESNLGYSSGETVGMQTRQLYASEEAWLALGSEAYPLPPPGKIIRTEIEFVCKDKRRIWVDLSGTMLDVDSGTSLWCYVDITEKKRAMDLIHESESRFHAMADCVAILIWIATTDKLCNWFNKGWLNFTGRSMAQEIGNGWAEGVHVEDFDRCLKTYITAFDAREEFVMEYRLRRFDGQYRWLLDHGVPRFDAQANFLGYIGTCVDINDSKQFAQALQASQQRLMMAQEAARIGVYELDLINGQTYMTSEFERLFGLKSGDQREALLALVHPDDLASFQAQIATAVEQHEPFEVEFRYSSQGSSETRWAINRGKTLYDDAGKPIKRLGINMDITERKRVEAENERLQKIVEEAPEYIAMTDMQARHIYLNKAGAGMVGLPEDVNCSTLEIKDMHPPWAARRVLEEAIPIVLSQGYWQGENALLHRDGREIPVSQLLLVHRDKFGNPLHLSTIMRDISEQKASQIEITQAKEAAEAANLAKSRFLATMSHEIRTPMNGILGMAQLLLMSNLNEHERGDAARTILTSGETLLTLLNDILDLSKIEAGKVQLEYITFDPSSLICETHELFASTVQAKGLQLQHQWLGPPDHRYQADAYRLRQMLSNLVNNAIKFTEQGSICIQGNELQRDDETALLEFSVSDTGIGIPVDKIELLFKPFSQADESTTREYGGTGLGLSIVLQLAKLMGGDVGIDSEVGKGSRFWFQLRAKLIAESRSSEHPVPAIAALLPAPLCGRVLVVEDNPVNCVVIESLLTKLGIHVTHVHDGQQALDTVTLGDRPDLILMDLNMPVMDGFKATEAIRQWEITHHQPRLPIIALTANAYDVDRQRCLNVGMDDFLTKPVMLDALQSALSPWLSFQSARDKP